MPRLFHVNPLTPGVCSYPNYCHFCQIQAGNSWNADPILVGGAVVSDCHFQNSAAVVAPRPLRSKQGTWRRQETLTCCTPFYLSALNCELNQLSPLRKFLRFWMDVEKYWTSCLVKFQSSDADVLYLRQTPFWERCSRNGFEIESDPFPERVQVFYNESVLMLLGWTLLCHAMLSK